jgi:alpha-tubulin suppressor-like RCC1 family protein
VTDQGKLISWPGYEFPDKINFSQTYSLGPMRYFLQQKISVSQVSQGLNFALALTSQGLVYSWGSQNEYGELGVGDTSPRSEPCLLEHLRRIGEKITQISSGQKHSVCLSGLGRVYTWGWGERGQLGHSGYMNEMLPRQVLFQK